MIAGNNDSVLVAHARAPVLRLIRTNLEADGLQVETAASAGACLKVLQSAPVGALVLDAQLIQGDARQSASLLRYLLATRVPLLLVSFEPADRSLARTLHGAPFCSRPDDIDGVRELVHGLLASATRTSSLR